MTLWQRVEPLDQHDLGAFACGDEVMDIWIREKAHDAQRRGSARVHVCVDENDEVCGVFALANLQLTPTDIPRSASGGLSIVPGLLLARFARHESLKGKSAGPALMTEVMKTAIEINELVPIRILLLDAKNEALASWYASLGFQPLPTNPLRLFMPMKKVTASYKAAMAID